MTITNGKPSPISAKLMKITPQMAEGLIARNTHNRNVTESRVRQYAADIKRGDWQLNGEAIKISADGQILDGQHRLLAVLDADAPITTLLITGLPEETQETMDQGRARSFADVLKLRSEADYNVLAAAVRIVCIYERDGVPLTSGRDAPTVPQLSRTLDRNPDIRDSVKLARTLHRRWLGASTIAALHYLFSIASTDDADDFIRRLTTGENLTGDCPIYVLRERLMKEHDEETRLHLRTKTAFIVRAWNAYRTGEHLHRLVWNPGGAHPDRFPQIDGLASAVVKAA